MTVGAALRPRTTGKPRTTPASDGQPTAQVSSRFRAFAQVGRSPGLPLARRKPGVQIPSPPPLVLQGPTGIAFGPAEVFALDGLIAQRRSLL